jgi:hypothetical protein
MSPVLRPLRKREDMPDFVRKALDERGLRDKYDARPPYQRNDYLLWINKVKGEKPSKSTLIRCLMSWKPAAFTWA